MTVLGCGQSAPSGAAGGDATTAQAGSGPRLPAAAIAASTKPALDESDVDVDEEFADGSMTAQADPEDADQSEPKEGSAAWRTREIMKLRLLPPTQTDDVDQMRDERKQRNERIIELSQQVVVETHSKPEHERLFTVAVHHLLEARMQLAMAGHTEHLEGLYDDAGALYQRAPESAAAAEGALSLVNLAYHHAKAAGATDPRWLKEFNRQAIHYAASFPKEEVRSAPLLFTAARSCEVNGLTDEAQTAYSVLLRTFPQNAYAARVTSILRRLKLPGNPAQIGGPKLGGGNVTIDDCLGQVVLLVFWSTETTPFLDQFPQLVALNRRHGSDKLAVIGIPLDTSAEAVQQFLTKHRLNWPQIFFAEADKQGWNNPLVNYYGVLEIPAYWLIDQQGNVVSTTLGIHALDAAIAEQLEGPAAATSADAGK